MQHAMLLRRPGTHVTNPTDREYADTIGYTPTMDIDQDKIDGAVLALLWLTKPA